MQTLSITSIAELIIAFAPLIAAAAKIIDIRQEKRQRATMKFNSLLLWGIKVTGEISRASAVAQRNGRCNGETEAALNEHDKFMHELDKFVNHQASQTL